MYTQHIIVVDVYNKNAHQTEKFEFWAGNLELAQERFDRWFKRNEHKYKVLDSKAIKTQRG